MRESTPKTLDLAVFLWHLSQNADRHYTSDSIAYFSVFVNSLSWLILANLAYKLGRFSGIFRPLDMFPHICYHLSSHRQ